MTVTVICVMGLPGSGKTTISERLKAISLNPGSGHMLGASSSLIVNHISFDDIEIRERRNQKYFEPEAWRKAREIALCQLSTFRTHHSASNENEILVILDDNFYYKSMRKRFRPDGVIFINRNVDDCMRLNNSRVNRVPETVIENMALMIEVPDGTSEPLLTVTPSPDESVDEIVTSILNAHDFWADVRVKRDITPPTQTTVDISIRERMLNECESQLRKCVSNFARTRTMHSNDVMKKTSELKASIMARCKFLITPDSSEDDIAGIIESAVLEFNHQLATF